MFQSLLKYFTKPPAQKKQSCITIFNLFIQIQFIFEQLELCQVKLHTRRYSVNLISTSSFIWQITSSSLYQKLQDLFILSSVSSLLKLSWNSSVECCDIDMEYLRIQSNDLSESEKWLFFWMTKNRTSKQKFRTIYWWWYSKNCSYFQDSVNMLKIQRCIMCGRPTMFKSKCGSVSPMVHECDEKFEWNFPSGCRISWQSCCEEVFFWK